MAGGRAWLLALIVACSSESTVRVGAEGSGGESGAPVEDADGESSSGASGDDSSSSSGGAALDDMPIETPQVRVEAGEIDGAELVERLPIGRSEAEAKRRVVLRLSDVPDLAVGDRLVAPAEVQVTTRCDVGQTEPGCGYDPKIRAQLILTGDRDDLLPSGPESYALSDAQTQTCTKNEHHCMFVFRPGDAENVVSDLPCLDDRSCVVNLVMWAWDGQARAGGVDEVLVGGNEGNFLDNGIVEDDRARLMAIRERGIVDDDRELRETSGHGTKSVPTTTEPVRVYSHRLGGNLRRGEQFIIEAKIVASVGGRARFSAEMFVTKDPDATDGGSFDAIAPGQIGEHNGINCLPSQSRCTLRKVAVFRVRDDVDAPVHVNVVVKSAVPGGGSTNVTIHRGEGWVRSTGYSAAHEG